MESFFGRHKNATVLAAVLFAQLLGLATQIKTQTDRGSVRLVRYWAVAVVTPFEKGLVYTQDGIKRVWTNYIYLRGVRQQNEQLQQQIDQMRIQQVRLQEDADQARRIQALLAFKEQYIAQTVAAQVIGTSGTEQSRIISIDRGSNNGIKTDMAVITPDGIVGKILTVYPTTSQVLEITDPMSGVGAILETSRLMGILKGSPTGLPYLDYVMSDEKVQVGENVVTSGGDGIYPKGFPIGKVASVGPGRDLYLKVPVKPAAALDSLEEVLVITQVVDKSPDTTNLGPIRAADILAQRLPSVPQQKQPAASPVVGEAPATPSAPGAAQPQTKPPAAQPQATPPAKQPQAKPPAAGPDKSKPNQPVAKPKTPVTQSAPPQGPRP